MRIKILVFILMVTAGCAKAQTGEETLQRMHERYAGKWFRTITFVQQTETFRNDSLIRTATWYEAAKFPFDLRIDNEHPINGNATIYRRDSTYRFTGGKLSRTTAGTNPFLVFIGGLYSMPLASAKQILTADGFDLSKGYTTNWKGRKAFVIGAKDGDTTAKQVWVDAEHLYVVRYLEKSRNRVMDVVMGNHVPLGQGWTETLVDFYFDGKLGQREKYRDMKADRPLEDDLFDPAAFGKWHWMK